MNKIKILNVIPSLQDGGIESLIYKIYRNLDKSKFDLHVCCLANIELEYSYKRFIDSGCKVKTFNFVNTNRKFYHVFTNMYQFIKLMYYFNLNRFRIVHSQDFFSALVTRVALILSRVVFYKPRRNYVTLHNMQFWLNKFHRLINRFLSFSTDKIICISNSVFMLSREKDKIKENKYKIIYNGIDVNEFIPDKKAYMKYRRELGYSETDIVIGHVGTFSIRKGQEYLVKAFAKLCEKYQNIKLLLIGGYRKHEPNVYNEVIRLIKKFNLENRSNVLKTRDDICNIYNVLDLFIMPSTVEGFGLALAEAMSTGRVVIVSNIPPFKEIIDDGYDGFLFESKNYLDLTDKMDMVLNKSKDELSEISKNARTKIVNRFNSEIMSREYDKLYNID